MEYKAVSEIANRAKNIGDLYLSTYNKFVSADRLSRLQRDDILNDLYHVVHATELLSEDEFVKMGQKDPFAHGAGIVISSVIYANSIAEEGDMLRSVICNLIAKTEENFFYPTFKYKRDMKKIQRHQNKVLQYKRIIDRDYLSYIASLGEMAE